MIQYEVGDIEKTTSLRKQRMGSTPGGSRFPVKVSGMRSSGDAGTETGREEYEADKEKGGVEGV